MTFIPHQTEKYCFVACSKEKVNSGLCDCINRIKLINQYGGDTEKQNKMKHSLRERIETELKYINDRINILDRHIHEYVAAENYNDAAINKIKRETLRIIAERLEQALA